MATTRKQWRRRVLWVLAALVGVIAVIPVIVTWIERRQERDVRNREPYVESRGEGRPAVVYFSRSGNTALAARHIANRLRAELFPITATDYELGLGGWVNAMQDARGREADISPRTLDLEPYDPIYLGSPIWLYSPAPPIWAFVESNRFDGKRVVFFNTLNSEFDPERIEELREAVLERGARELEHRWVRRGRMTQQISPEELIDAIDAEWLVGPDAPPP